jgi:GT2 family glycosyltransferase
VRRTLPALAEQLREGDDLIVVDNGSADGTAALVAELAPDAKLIEAGGNLGFAAGCNRGAEAAEGELLVLLNPDAVPGRGWRDAIERPASDGRDWTAWMALVTAEDGRVVNTGGGVVHFTGIAWAGNAGQPAERAAAAGPHEVAFASGACLAIGRDAWREQGGFPESFFLYQEDVDLSLRLRLAGGRLGIEPGAVVDHDYDFDKGVAKWRYLERNRWAMLLRTYPVALLVLIAPALLLTEVALLFVSLAGGWSGQKLRAAGETLAALPRLLRERREIQSRRAIGAAEFADSLTADLSSPYLGRVGGSAPLRWALRAYWSLVRALLGAGSSRSS